ncbi:hypothetical protein LZZ90_08985 [Flavobacterium sp. SM15]|uniref:TPR end-of-group domain-containing protein n=1 Tax=Flavobacterium sp. SM15 TaxID=2908005 RepID=UPI001EDACC5C|nr:hypothetical protein [Flavobacterium sp. SM15]MCG2611640.1 hypothetical protein [Flavobacterium sp. SM15]
MKHLILSFTATFLVSAACFSQSQRELYNQSTEAYKTRNYPQFLKLTEKLDSIRPMHPTFTYNLSAAYALNNEKEKAISVLEKLVQMNNKIDFEKDTDFNNIRQSEEFQNILKLKAELNNPVVNSQKVISLNDKELHPESLIYLEKQKLWLASSIRQKKIVAFDLKTGKCSNWFTESHFSTFAMKTDKKEKYLWVATAAMPEMIGFTKEMEGRAEVLKIDSKTKKVVKRFPVEGNHVFGDLVLDNKGNAYVSDSGEALVYKISDDKLSVWLDLKKEAFNLQGITFNEDFSKIFIADYLKGILVIDVQNPQNRNWLKFPKGTTVKGIDGLLFYKNTLLAIHNGVNPIRVIQYNLTENHTAISSFRIIDINRPEFDEPALGTIVANNLFFFSNSPWKAYTKDEKLDGTKFENPMLFQYQIK